MYTIWSALTWVFLPTGCATALIVLSGYETLEKIGQWVCRVEIHVGEAKIKLPHLIAFVCACCFGGEWYSLERLRSQRNLVTLEPLEFNDTWRALLWRHQRNWWLSLSSLMLWLILWRIDVLVQSFRNEIHAIQIRRMELLKERAELLQVERTAAMADALCPKDTTPKPEKEKKRD